MVDIRDGEAAYRTTAGSSPACAPQDADFWVAAGVGTGAQEITWTPENGDWAVLVMDAGAGRGVEVSVTAGAEVPGALLGRRNPALARRDRSGPLGGPHRGSAAEGLARRWWAAMTWLIAAFLIAHGAVHLAVWLPTPPPADADPQAPFAPDHSALLTRTRVPQAASHRLAVRLAGVDSGAVRRRRTGGCPRIGDGLSRRPQLQPSWASPSRSSTSTHG